MKKDHTPEYMKQLSGKILEINFKTQSLKMSFQATEDICHSNGTIIQGGFTTVMMDSCMAFLVMELTDFIFTPMSIDINVSFLAAGRPGKLECQSKIVKLGNSIGFAKAETTQSAVVADDNVCWVYARSVLFRLATTEVAVVVPSGATPALVVMVVFAR